MKRRRPAPAAAGSTDQPADAADASVPAVRKRSVGRPFQPGQSGNPSGRPAAVRDVAAAAREHTADALRVLAEIMSDPEAHPPARVRAAEVLLDRAWGRAPQTIALTDDLGRLSDDQLDARIRAMAAEALAGAALEPLTIDGEPIELADG